MIKILTKIERVVNFFFDHVQLMDLIDRKKDAHCFEIIDCRYPYEYEGGHIKGAVSVWAEEALYKE